MITLPLQGQNTATLQISTVSGQAILQKLNSKDVFVIHTFSNL
jgi:hypothetical protein